MAKANVSLKYNPLDFRGKDFLSLKDYSSDQLMHILDVASKFKAKPQSRALSGKTLGMIFSKASTRTRVSFEVGVYQMGGLPLFLSQNDIQLGRGETIADTARVLSRYLDGIMIRTHAHKDVEELARWSTIPVINGLTDLLHPCQAVADFLTIEEIFDHLQGLKLAFIGDGNNMAHSLMIGAAKLGMDFAIACPKGYEPCPHVVSWAKRAAMTSGSNIEVHDDPVHVATGAHILYTDVWTSMGQEETQEARKKTFAPYQINQSLLDVAAKESVVLHCLPAHRGEEITDEVIEGCKSAVFQQAENRLHVQKAIMALTMGEPGQA